MDRILRFAVTRVGGLLVALVVAGILSGCAGTPAPKAVESIHVDREAPPTGATQLQSLTAVDGEGCGMFGTPGTYEGALKKLRKSAKSLGADYVQITHVKEPYADHQCAHRVYTVTGTAYRVHAPAPATSTPPAQAVASVSAPGPAAPTASASAPATGLLIGANGCSLRSDDATSSHSLSFSARVTTGAGFALWIEDSKAGGTPGLELRFDRAGRRLSVIRHGGPDPAMVAPVPFELDTAWHEWRLVRDPDRVSIWLDQKPILAFLAPSASETNFRLDGDGLEIRRLSAEKIKPEPN